MLSVFTSQCKQLTGSTKPFQRCQKNTRPRTRPDIPPSPQLSIFFFQLGRNPWILHAQMQSTPAGPVPCNNNCTAPCDTLNGHILLTSWKVLNKVIDGILSISTISVYHRVLWFLKRGAISCAHFMNVRINHLESTHHLCISFSPTCAQTCWVEFGAYQ